MLGSLWRFLIRTAATAAALWVVVTFIDGVTVTTPQVPLYGTGEYDLPLTFLGVAAVIVLLNSTVKPILSTLGLPLTILTLGLFTLVINAVILLLAEYLSDWLGLGLGIDSFGSAFLGAIVLALVTMLLSPITGKLGAEKR